MGVTDWDDVAKHPLWIAGREIGVEGVAFNPGTTPGTAGGVTTPAGYVPQSGGASPKASTGAANYADMSLELRPILNRTDFEHLLALVRTQQRGLPAFWNTIPWVESWSIRNNSRTEWTLAGTISGSTPGLGKRGLHIVPLVEIRDGAGVVIATTVPADWPGAATLTIGADVIVPSASDISQITTVNLSSYAGGSLVIHYFGTMPVEITSLQHDIVGVNDFQISMELVVRPPQKNYEGDN